MLPEHRANASKFNVTKMWCIGAEFVTTQKQLIRVCRMKLKPKITIADHCAELEDPRLEQTLTPSINGCFHHPKICVARIFQIGIKSDGG